MAVPTDVSLLINITVFCSPPFVPPSPHSLSLPLPPSTQLDLASRGTLSIQLVHPSVSPKHSCFRIITDAEILYASCGSQEELNKWITR